MLRCVCMVSLCVEVCVVCLCVLRWVQVCVCVLCLCVLCKQVTTTAVYTVCCRDHRQPVHSDRQPHTNGGGDTVHIKRN